MLILRRFRWRIRTILVVTAFVAMTITLVFQSRRLAELEQEVSVSRTRAAARQAADELASRGYAKALKMLEDADRQSPVDSAAQKP